MYEWEYIYAWSLLASMKRNIKKFSQLDNNITYHLEMTTVDHLIMDNNVLKDVEILISLFRVIDNLS